ncbi:MAG: pentapeptide repeat-containing protein [Phycicoccus sp.]
MASDSALAQVAAHVLWQDTDGKQGQKLDTEELDLAGAQLAGLDLGGAGLVRANLRGADLRGANLFYSALFRADLSGADLSGALLSKSDMAHSTLIGARLRAAQLIKTALCEADLSGANLSRAYLFRTDLDGANLRGVDFTEADCNLTFVGRAIWDENSVEDATGTLVSLDETMVDASSSRPLTLAELIQRFTDAGARLTAFHVGDSPQKASPSWRWGDVGSPIVGSETVDGEH